MVMPLQVDRFELERSVVRDCFYEFVRRFWHVVVPETPVWNWHIEYLCDELQEVAERVFRGEEKLYDVIINIPPGTSKSTIASVLFPAWVWTRMRTARSICASYSFPLAMDLSRKSRDVVQSEKWKQLFGKMELREDQNSKSYFMNEEGGMRYAVGTNGSVTGFHGHFLIIDDPIDPESAMSEADLKTANRWVTETLSARKVDKKISVTILIMQRLHQNDPSSAMLKRAEDGGAKLRHIRLPGEISPGAAGYEEVRPRKLAKKYKDGLLDPVRLPRRALEEMRITLGQFGYAGQILQKPSPLGGGMFKVDRIMIDIPPRLRDFIKLVRFWDKAGTKGGGAFTAGVLMGEDREHRFWILDVVRGQWDSGAREKIIKQTAIIDGRKVVIGIEQEPGSGGKESAQATIKRLAGYKVHLQKPGASTGDKVERADPFSVQVNGENVYMVAAPWNRIYLDELQHFPFSTYKDQTDASSGAFTDITQTRIRVGGLSAPSQN